MDEKSRQLFPLIYHRLAAREIDPAELEVLKQEYQTVRLKNSLLFQAALKPIGALVGVGIPTMLLKGAALSLRYYQDLALRPMSVAAMRSTAPNTHTISGPVGRSN